MSVAQRLGQVNAKFFQLSGCQTQEPTKAPPRSLQSMKHRGCTTVTLVVESNYIATTSKGTQLTVSSSETPFNPFLPPTGLFVKARIPLSQRLSPLVGEAHYRLILRRKLWAMCLWMLLKWNNLELLMSLESNLCFLDCKIYLGHLAFFRMCLWSTWHTRKSLKYIGGSIINRFPYYKCLLTTFAMIWHRRDAFSTY